MVFVLRNLATGLFYADNGWTSFPDFAHKFGDQEQAKAAVQSAGMKDVEIVMVSSGYVVGGTPINGPNPDIQPPNP